MQTPKNPLELLIEALLQLAKSNKNSNSAIVAMVVVFAIASLNFWIVVRTPYIPHSPSIPKENVEI
ncbi:MAG: hypothetical protein AAGA60_13810 [Cyanobacteria bacterium P01_E01_bin.42]